MPPDLARIIDCQLYLATQQCLAPYPQRRQESNDTAGAGTGTGSSSTTTGFPPEAQTGSARRSSFGSPRRPKFWHASLGSGGEEAVHTPSSSPYSQRSDSTDTEPFVTPPVGQIDAPVLLPGVSEEPAGGGVMAKSGKVVTAPVPESIASSTSEDSSGDYFARALASLGMVDTPLPRVLAEAVLRPPFPPRQSPPQPSLYSQAPATAATEEAVSPSEQQHPPPSNQSLSPLSTTHWPSPLARVTSITLLVEDVRSTARFYEDVFSVQPIHEDDTSAAFRFNGGALLVTLYVSWDAREHRLLGEDVHVGKLRDIGRRFMLSVVVDDLNEEYERLRRLEREWDEDGKGSNVFGNPRVIERLSKPRVNPWGLRSVTFQDPSGHCWELAEEL